MEYLKVKPDSDGVCRYAYNVSGYPIIDGHFIADELYTVEEFSQFLNTPDVCERVEISENQTYHPFYFDPDTRVKFPGYRFAMESEVK